MGFIALRGTRIVAQALLAIPDAPPACFRHWRRQASVPLAALAGSPSQVQCCTWHRPPGRIADSGFQMKKPLADAKAESNSAVSAPGRSPMAVMHALRAAQISMRSPRPTLPGVFLGLYCTHCVPPKENLAKYDASLTEDGTGQRRTSDSK